jgi:hypothetical protein
MTERRLRDWRWESKSEKQIPFGDDRKRSEGKSGFFAALRMTKLWGNEQR